MGSRSVQARTRATARVAVLTVLLGLLVPVVGAAVAAAPAAASPGTSTSTTGAPGRATSGSGAHRAVTGWVTWGAAGAAVANGATITTAHQVSEAERAEVTCVLSQLAGTLAAYRPGQYAADGLDDLYGGLTSGLATTGRTTSFTVACTAELVRYDGNGWGTAQVLSRRAVPLGGLVLADAESATGSDYVQGTVGSTSSTSPWRLIDRYQGACPSRDNVARAAVSRPTSSTWRVRLTNTDSECASGGATGVLLADGASSLSVELRGSGTSAAAVGYVLGVDHGDAVASYGTAAALVQPTWQGGRLNENFFTTTGLAGYETTCVLLIFCSRSAVTDPATATTGTPAVSIGASVAANLTVPASADALGDQPDEDAFVLGALPGLSVLQALPHTVAVPCRGTSAGLLAGWIDWNRNGTFDDGERSSLGACTGTSLTGGLVTLSWTVPADTVPGPTVMRLRVATTETDLQRATGASLVGEVEDWALTVVAPQLQVTRTLDRTQVPAAGGTVTSVLTVRNTGTLGLTALQPALVYDELSGVLDDATVTSQSASSGTLATVGSRRVWTGALGVGQTATITTVLRVSPSPGDRVMTFVARPSLTSVLATTPVVCDVGSADLLALRCTRSQLWAVGVTVVKVAYLHGSPVPLVASPRLRPGTAVDWRYTVVNTGTVALVDVRVSDSWQEQRRSAAGTAQTSGGAVLTCDRPDLTPGVEVVVPRLAPGEQVVCHATGEVVRDP